jgi:hypothetical protein
MGVVKGLLVFETAFLISETPFRNVETPFLFVVFELL